MIASLNKKLETVQWGEYEYNDFFKTIPIRNKLKKSDLNEDGVVEVFSAMSSNNGVIGFTNQVPDYIVDEETPFYICFGDHTRSFNIAKNSFCVMDNVKVLRPIKKHSVNILLFIVSSWKRNIQYKGYARHWSLAKKTKINLPTKNGQVDFSFMEEIIKELENLRIKRLNTYLSVTGLEDYHLTDQEKWALNNFEKLDWEKFKVKDLFDVEPYRKKFDANKVTITENEGYPYIVRTEFDNGLKGYINEDKQYLNDGNTISFGQDTATIFYQEKPYFTGDKIKILYPKLDEFKKNNAHFFTVSMSKSFTNFSWGRSSFSEEIIKNQNMELPITKKGDIDIEYMNILTKAIYKLVIKNVVLWTDTYTDD